MSSLCKTVTGTVTTACRHLICLQAKILNNDKNDNSDKSNNDSDNNNDDQDASSS